ncbi:MAG: endolytic transglycosylase MltG [Patescibacteria group bacterium]
MRFRILFLILFLLAAAAGLGYGFLVWELNRPIADSGKVELTISSGESVQEIGVKLQEAGVMNSLLFVFYVRSKNLTAKIQAGKYEIPLTLTPIQVVNLLQHGTFDVRLTFFEGWRKEQYLGYALEILAVDDEEFTSQFNTATKDLEGYLFPDTYFVPINLSAENLVAILRDNFSTKYSQVKAAAATSGLTQKQIVTIASLVERETADDSDSQEEMRTIAGIIVKRLKIGMLLQVDATLQYILGYQEDSGKWWTMDTAKIVAAKKVDSPYNTYKYLGLPSGPITNPGLDSLSATANYVKNTPFLYYLHCNDGQVRYAKTLGEHIANQACLK